MMATTASAVQGSSASPPPNHHLTPRLAAMRVHPPLDLDELDDPGRHMVHCHFENCDDSSSQHFVDRCARSPSPALTVSNGRTTPPSVTDSLAPSSSALASPRPTTISTSSPPLPGGSAAVNPPPAEMGLCSLKDEEELKIALTTKERLSVLIIGKEIEAFIGRVHRGEHTSSVQSSQPSTSTSPLDQLGPSKKLDFAAHSKYLRRIVYKLAAWYGLRAVVGEKHSMVVGVDGVLDPQSTTLQIAKLVPETAEVPTQQFRIMQRDTLSVTDEDGGSRATSVSADDNTDSPGHRRTLEEREIAYKEAKKRIYGGDGDLEEDSMSTAASQPRSRQASRYGDGDDEFDIPRRTLQSEREIVYGSLSHPTPERSSVPPVSPGSHGGPPAFNQPYADGYQGMQQAYMGYQMGPDLSRQMGPYPNQQFSGPMPLGGYGPPWQPQPMPGQMQMMGMMPHGAQGWYPPDMGVPSQQAHNMMSMMPIPQGLPMPYAPPMSNGHPQQVQQGRSYGPPLAHPMPMRAGLDPLSSTASSISSRSYQDVHSRPHSRGSTTSTRSAASSVRLGSMYPSGQQSYGYRQKAVKPSQGSFSSSIGRPTIDTRRSGRQSPASTTSSRSSRRASSIQIQQPQPGQHPLPPRPDWAANNVPYHPSSAPHPGAEPSTSDFPPLHRGAQAPAFRAEPMQIEKVKMRPSPAGTAWNGSGSEGNRNDQHTYGSTVYNEPSHVQLNPFPDHGGSHPDMTTPQQMSPVASEVAVSILRNPTKAPMPVPPVLVPDIDPDFPRRMPPSSRTPSLYDPSAPVPSSRPVRHSPAPSPSHAPAVAEHSMSPSAPSAPQPRHPPSYAKIVRRD
ncbi:hypothetical protein CC85DRAFT_284019 [Cutaneotrichosporon oleaginosum]|uniref:SUZ domain-containing protein n=1 Tax=Cutaneotrichosporon oleaginosum TaxID=879819 RepID=A0A0J0XSB9_9TREE|nr:uncharacterized protein CC85DRAFT_284019 [Cutaneotrichosporon oleaginosum]KLT43978.1 hypothetical protein CC85DRAFT_284019 [Cutaneotrichosporon oleaginosum]TXT04074.1 hypothetical protein COLE_07771 [Cutaneotrichosporon oleaginosum]